MMKKLALTASIITMVAISGQAFARATGSNTRYGLEVATSSDQQVVPATVAQTAGPEAYAYHGGPKYND